MGDQIEHNGGRGGSVSSKRLFRNLVDKVIADPEFRRRLEADPNATLSSMSIEVTDSAALVSLENSLKHAEEALLADDNGKKVFAVGTAASIVAAVSTPAFPKGHELNDSGKVDVNS